MHHWEWILSNKNNTFTASTWARKDVSKSIKHSKWFIKHSSIWNPATQLVENSCPSSESIEDVWYMNWRNFTSLIKGLHFKHKIDQKNLLYAKAEERRFNYGIAFYKKRKEKKKERKTKYMPKKMKIFKREKQKSPEYSFLLWRTRWWYYQMICFLGGMASYKLIMHVTMVTLKSNWKIHSTELKSNKTQHNYLYKKMLLARFNTERQWNNRNSPPPQKKPTCFVNL